MATFPAYAMLRFPDFTEQPEAGTIRTPMEGGLAKQRAFPSRVMVERPVSYLIKTKADYLSFKDWYENTIARAGWFDWTDPVTVSVIQARIKGGKIEPRALRKDMELWRVDFIIEAWGV